MRIGWTFARVDLLESRPVATNVGDMGMLGWPVPPKKTTRDYALSAEGRDMWPVVVAFPPPARFVRKRVERLIIELAHIFAWLIRKLMLLERTLKRQR